MSDMEWASSNNWEQVQNQTFLTWVNHHLEKVNMRVSDFTTDLADGLKLIALLEVLTGMKFPRYVKNPRFAAQKLANITEALDFMTRHYGIKFVGCNAQDIMDGKNSQCMGVIFLLINKIKTLSAEADREGSLHPSRSSGQLNQQSPNKDSPSSSVPASPKGDTSTAGFATPMASPSSTKLGIARKPNIAANFPRENSLPRTKPVIPPKASPKQTPSAEVSSVHEIPTDPEKRKAYYITLLQAAARGYLARKQLAKLKACQQQVDSLFNHHPESVAKLTRLQAAVRGMRLRNTPMFRARRKRNEIVKEILYTEEKYVKSLEVCVNVYMKSLESLGESVLPATKIRSIFSEIKVIMSYNTFMHNLLKARLASWFTKDQTLGDIFLQFTDFLKVYTAYVNNYNESMKTMQELSLSNQVFVETLQTCRADSRVGGMELSSYLIMPIQRIPRYVLLLSDLFKTTPENHKDYAPLQNALSKMEGVASYVNQKKREAENLLGVATVANHLVGLENANEFNQPHRRYVRQGPLMETEPSSINAKSLKNRYIFLFNDILICTKENTGVLGKSKIPPNGLDIETLRTTDIQFKYLYSFPLLGTMIHEIPEQNKVTNLFELVDTMGRKILFQAPSQQLKDEWIQELDEMIMSCLEKHRSRIGVPASEERIEIPAEQKTPSLTGFLYKRSEDGSWKKKYFVLTQDVLTYYPDIVSSMDPSITPKAIPLIFAGIFHLPLLDRHFCMRLFTKERVYNLSSDNAHDRLQWVNMIRAAVSKRLSELDLKLKSTQHALAPTVIISAMPGDSSTSSFTASESFSSTTSNNIPSRDHSAGNSPSPSDKKKRSKSVSEDDRKKRKKTLNSATVDSSVLATNAAEGDQDPFSPSTSPPPSSSTTDDIVDGKATNGKSSTKISKKKKKTLKGTLDAPKSNHKSGEAYKVTLNPVKATKTKIVLKDSELSIHKSGKGSKGATVLDLLLTSPISNEVETQVISKDQTLFVFQIVSTDRKYLIGCEAEEDAHSWIEHIHSCQEALKN